MADDVEQSEIVPEYVPTSHIPYVLLSPNDCVHLPGPLQGT
jgi:hypothetical protein